MYSYASIRACLPQWLIDSPNRYVLLLDFKGQVIFSNRDLVDKPRASVRNFMSWVHYPADLNFSDVHHALCEEKSQTLCIREPSSKTLDWTIWDYNEVEIEGENCIVAVGRKEASINQTDGDLITNSISSAVFEGAVFSVADHEGKIIMVNDNFCELTQYTREELVGYRHMDKLYEYQPRSFWMNLIIKVRNGEQWIGDIKVQTKGGEVLWFHTVVSPILDEEGALKQILHIQYDITEHKKALEEKLEIYDRYDKITTNMPGYAFQCHVRHDMTRRFSFLTDGVESLFGLTCETLMKDAEPYFDRVHEEDQDEVLITMEESIRTKSHWNQAFRMYNNKKELIWVQHIGTPEKLADGSFMWHGFAYDITDRIKSEALLQNKEEKLSEIAFMQAHELRRPIANMMGILDLLQIENGALDKTKEQLVEWLQVLQITALETDEIITRIVQTADSKETPETKKETK